VLTELASDTATKKLGKTDVIYIDNYGDDDDDNDDDDDDDAEDRLRCCSPFSCEHFTKVIIFNLRCIHNH